MFYIWKRWYPGKLHTLSQECQQRSNLKSSPTRRASGGSGTQLLLASSYFRVKAMTAVATFLISLIALSQKRSLLRLQLPQLLVQQLILLIALIQFGQSWWALCWMLSPKYPVCPNITSGDQKPGGGMIRRTKLCKQSMHYLTSKIPWRRPRRHNGWGQGSWVCLIQSPAPSKTWCLAGKVSGWEKEKFATVSPNDNKVSGSTNRWTA